MASILDAIRLPKRFRVHSDSDLGLKLAQRLTVEDIIAYRLVDTAADAETTFAIASGVNRDLKLLAARYVPHATLTANDTNYATLAIKVGATTLASVTTKITGGTGDWVLNTPEALTIASSSITSGDVLLGAITKEGTGVAVPAGYWHIIVAER